MDLTQKISVIVPLVTIVLTIAYAVWAESKRRAIEEKRVLESEVQKADGVRWASLQRHVEQNSRYTKDVEKQVDSLSNTVRTHYLPRNEFQDFLNQLDKRFDAQKSQAEKNNLEIQKIVLLTIEGALAKLELKINKGDK